MLAFERLSIHLAKLQQLQLPSHVMVSQPVMSAANRLGGLLYHSFEIDKEKRM
jgi:hypothetical protein